MEITFERYKKYDHDGAFGAQCVDLFRCYCDMLKIPQPLPVTGAIDLYDRWCHSTMTKIEGSSNLKVGDVVFKKASINNKYGHVAIVICVEDDIITVAEQNGFTLKGLEIGVTSRSNWIGCLRPDIGESITFAFV